MKIKPYFDFIEYEPMGKIGFKNPLQAARFDAHGAKVYDIIRDKDCWIWLFDSKEIKPLFDRWCKYDLPQKE